MPAEYAPLSQPGQSYFLSRLFSAMFPTRPVNIPSESTATPSAPCVLVAFHTGCGLRRDSFAILSGTRETGSD